MPKLFRSITLFAIISIFSLSVSAKPVPDSFADLVEKLNPAVVNISTTQTIEGVENPFEDLFSHNFPEGSPFGELPELFKKFYGENGNGTVERKSTSLGSGFVVSPEGYIVTNYHVVEKADEITVIFSDDSKSEVEIIGKDSKTDVALLKIKAEKELEYVKFGDSDKARVGDWVIAIGNPFGLGGSVSAGIISARARDINAGPFDDFLQTDAAINRGNSGGPLFNINGEVIGVNTAIFSPSGGNVGIGFAVPAALVEPVIKQLKETGHIQRGWLGVKIQTVTDEISESIGMKKAKGALVLDVTKDSPAGKGGLLPGDVITSFDGKDIPIMRRLPRIVAETPVGKKVAIVVWRKESKKTLVVTIDELAEEVSVIASKGNKDDKKKNGLKASKTVLGIGIKDIDKDIRKNFNVGKDVTGVAIVKIDPESPAAQKPIRKGDVITAINQEPVANINEVEKLINKAKESKRKSVLLLVNRGGDTLFIAVPTGK